MIPRSVHPLFWDVDIEAFAPENYPRFTIGRVLELGDEPVFAWLKELFSDAVIKTSCVTNAV